MKLGKENIKKERKKERRNCGKNREQLVLYPIQIVGGGGGGRLSSDS
jgi:hypothetical protein